MIKLESRSEKLGEGELDMNENCLKFVKNDRFAKLVGIELLEISEGCAVAQMKVEERHLNGVDLVQGGAIFTLADYAFAAASNSKGLVTVGINASISYFKSPRGRVITAKAREVSSGRKICGYEVDIFDENGELVAKFSGLGYVKG